MLIKMGNTLIKIVDIYDCRDDKYYDAKVDPIEFAVEIAYYVDSDRALSYKELDQLSEQIISHGLRDEVADNFIEYI
jgi:hypothetical protein